MHAEAYLSSNPDHPWNVHFNDQLEQALKDREVPIFPPFKANPEADAAMQATEVLWRIQHSRKLVVVALNMTVNQGVDIGLAGALGRPVIFLTTKDPQLPNIPRGFASKILYLENFDEDFDRFIYPLSQEILR